MTSTTAVMHSTRWSGR